MKLRIKRQKCKRKDCKKAVYADGLCRKHFEEKLQHEYEKNPDARVYGFKDKLGAVFNVISVLLIVLVWLLICISAVIFAKALFDELKLAFLPIVIAVLVIVLSYLPMYGVMQLYDISRLFKVIMTIALLLTAAVLIMNFRYAYANWVEILEGWARGLAKALGK